METGNLTWHWRVNELQDQVKENETFPGCSCLKIQVQSVPLSSGQNSLPPRLFFLGKSPGVYSTMEKAQATDNAFYGSCDCSVPRLMKFYFKRTVLVSTWHQWALGRSTGAGRLGPNLRR